MRVLGVDPGIAKIGWGIVDNDKGKYTAVKYGFFQTDQHLAMEERLGQIHQFFVNLIQEYKPTVLAVEQLYFSANTKTALTVGHSRGVILLAASNLQLPVFSFTPLQVKQALTGYGRADKHQIQAMTCALLKIQSLKQDDTADALAVALTYIFSEKMQNIQSRALGK